MEFHCEIKFLNAHQIEITKSYNQDALYNRTLTFNVLHVYNRKINKFTH